MRIRPLLGPVLALSIACRGGSETTAPVAAPAVTAVLSSSAIRLGEQVAVDVRATNTTNSPVEVHAPIGWLEVLDSRDAVIASGRLGIRYENMILLPPLRLLPGESAADRLAWRGERSDGGFATPGTYRIRAVIHVAGAEPSRAYSRAVPVEVVP